MAIDREKDQFDALERQLASEAPRLAEAFRMWHEPRRRVNTPGVWRGVIILAAAATAVALVLGFSQAALILAVSTAVLGCLRMLYGPPSAQPRASG